MEVGTAPWLCAFVTHTPPGRKQPPDILLQVERGNPVLLPSGTLLQESDTPIQRHVKIKAAANPHDPQWERYFESRWGKQMLNSARGRGKL